MWGDFLSPSFRLEPERPSTFSSGKSSVPSSLKKPPPSEEESEGFVVVNSKASASSGAPEDLLTSVVFQDSGDSADKSYASNLIPRLVHRAKGAW